MRPRGGPARRKTSRGSCCRRSLREESLAYGRHRQYSDRAMRPFASSKPLIGVVHLLPLPGSPRYRGPADLGPILDRAAADAEALVEGGADALIVENLGDAPFLPLAPPETVAAMAVAVSAITRLCAIPVGVNVLRNDAEAALGIAAVTGAKFVRVNVFCGTVVTDAGTIEGTPRTLLASRRRFERDIALLADVHVKHAAHFNALEEAAIDAARNGADALIVTGAATGMSPSADAFRAAECGGLPVIVGSGMTPEEVGAFGAAAGFVVGSFLHREGRIGEPIDADRVRRMADAVRALREG